MFIPSILKKLMSGMLDLVYPPNCIICEQRLSESEEQLCSSCLEGFHLLGKPHHHFSVSGEIYLSTTWALFEFDAAFQSLVHHLKYSRRRKPVLTVLNHYRDKIVGQLPAHFYDQIISIPLHARKLRERGYNQVDDISFWLAEAIDSKVGKQVVERIKYTQSQTKLNARQRKMNVDQVFKVTCENEVRESHILLVDDVLTTGATANSLAQVLQVAGASQIDLLTLSTPPHGNT